MESVIKDQLVQYLSYNNLISPNQHSFLANHSTTTNLRECVHDWMLSLQDRDTTDVIYVDMWRESASGRAAEPPPGTFVKAPVPRPSVPPPPYSFPVPLAIGWARGGSWLNTGRPAVMNDDGVRGME